jgi:hypothetical protein
MSAIGQIFLVSFKAAGGGGGGPTFTPESGVADTFTRSDGALGADWDDLGDFSSTVNLSVLSNQFGATAGYPSVASWGGTGTISNDHYAQIEVSCTGGSLSGGSDEIGVSIRNNGSTTCDCYTLRLVDNGSGNTILERWNDNAVAATLDTRNIAWAKGDTMLLGCLGTTIYVYRNGTQVYTVTDGNLTTGTIGLYGKTGSHETIRGDTFVGGNVT